MVEPLLSEKELTRIRRLRVAGSRVQRALARGERMSRQLGSGQEFAAHRPYSQGDDLRRLDWNIYGRLGQLFLKLYEAPGRFRVIVAIDASPTMDFGQAGKWLAARRVAAAAALIALGSADRVWLGSLDEQPRPFEGAAETRLLETLARMPVASQPSEQPRALLEMVAEGGADTVLILVTDLQHLDPPLQLLRELARHGGRSICLCIHAAEELSPGISGFARLQAPGFDALRLRVDDRVLAAYQAEVQRFREAAAHAVRSTGAGLLDIDSAAPLDPVLAAMTRQGLLASRRG